MKITLDQMTIKDKKVQGYLLAYLERIALFDNFDPEMELRVFVNQDKDFTMLEAKNYRLQFSSAAHKIFETINSGNYLDLVTYKDFYKRVQQIMKEVA